MQRSISAASKLAGGLFLVFLSMASGRFVIGDEAQVGRVALALATLHWGDLPVVKYSIGMPLLEAPFMALGLALEKVAPAGVGAALASTALALLPPIAGAALGVLCWLLSRELGHGAARAGLVAVAAALASPVLVYATRFFTELPQAVAVVGAVLWALRGNGVASGLCLGLLFLLKPVSGGLAIPFVAIFLWLNRRAEALRLVVPVLAAVTLELAYNKLRFGSPLEFGYFFERGRDRTYGFSGDLWTGLFGQTLSPGGGLLVFMPIVAPALVGLGRLGRRVPTARVLFWGIPLAFVVLHARWFNWHGGWNWGPRYVVPVIPLLAVGLGELEIETWPARTRAALRLTLVCSILVQIPGVLVSSTDYAQTVFAACHNRFPEWSAGTDDTPRGPVDDQANIHFIPALTPPLGHAWIAMTRVFGQRWPAPWESQEICPRMAIRPHPLEVWWSRASAGGQRWAPVAAALLLVGGVLLLLSWRQDIAGAAIPFSPAGGRDMLRAEG